MQNAGGFEADLYFGVCFADLPWGGLKKSMRSRCVRKDGHGTFQAVSWQDAHI